MISSIDSLFNTFNSHGLAYSDMDPDETGINFVTRSSKNNGIEGRVRKVPDIEPFEGNCITVAMQGSVMESFFQKDKFYSAYHIKILRPKKKMNIDEILFYCNVIRMNAWKYSFGRQANKTINNLLVPEYNDFKAKEGSLEFEKFSKEAPKLKDQTTSINTKNWKYFDYSDIFLSPKSSKDELVQDFEKGTTPYISSTRFNNGIIKKVDGKPTNNKNVLTVNRGGSVGEVFYQDKDFLVTPVDVRILKPKVKFNIFIGLFLATIIKKEKYRFNYSRKMGTKRLQSLKFKLPINNNGDPDWNFMQNYIKNIIE